MKGVIIKDKSFDFAVRIVNLYKHLVEVKSEYVLSKYLLKSGTSAGAMVREAEYAESNHDFVHVMAVAQKYLNETLYWLELLKATGYLTIDQYTNIDTCAAEIMKLISARIRITKNKLTTDN